MTRLARGAAQFKWRRQRREQSRRWPSLNLIALMDVFTILVFFFLVHSSDSAEQAQSELVKLPESYASQQPRDTPVVTITAQDIMLGGEPVVRVDVAMRTSGAGFEALYTALQAQAAPPTPGADTDEPAPGTAREVTIMGDRSIPFAVLNRVMRTCARAGYGDISLSVLQRATDSG